RAGLAGSKDPGPGLPVTPRPMQWARLLQCFDAALQAPVPMLSRSNPKPAPATAARAKQITDAVLVVDDNATVRKFMEAKLAPFGFTADFAETGEQAVGLTGAKEYTCVFLDVVLPGIDGYPGCKLIKSNKQRVKRTAQVTP